MRTPLTFLQEVFPVKIHLKESLPEDQYHVPTKISRAPSLQDPDYHLLAHDFQVNVGSAEVPPCGTWIIVANYNKGLNKFYGVALTPCHIHSHFTFISGSIE